MKGVLSWLVRWVRLPIERFLFCLGCFSRPSTKYYFPQRTLFQFICPNRPSPSKMVRQSCWVACLLLCVSGFNILKQDSRSTLLDYASFFFVHRTFRGIDREEKDCTFTLERGGAGRVALKRYFKWIPFILGE
jgi:hypothetical protein